MKQRQAQDWSIRSIIILVITTIKSIYTILLTAYKSITETIRLVNQFTPHKSLSSSLSHSSTLSIQSSDDKFITTPPGSIPSTPQLYRSLTESIPSVDTQADHTVPNLSSVVRDLPDYARPTLDLFSALLETEVRFASSALFRLLHMITAVFQSFLSKSVRF